ncbi:MAG: hypothetical protein Q8M88_04535 [Phenylobacterium sp.]|uniref:hypothetical protein n=1 Tax=Phenylobacterium sp. TaxID=1871053 RepID=UPI002735A72B|nr:hypothetical protein [Phenylobacterium sp.]MDP3173683.1 hypothetical protein [Phenylobacterium sp.]
MFVEDNTVPASAQKWARMPGAVQLQLERAIFSHMRKHGSRHYDLLRDDPQFAPWIGTHLGPRGEKRLDRLINRLRSNQPIKVRQSTNPSLRNSPSGAQQQPEVRPDHSPECETYVLTGATGALSYEEIEHQLRKLARNLEAVIKGCFNEYGEMTRPDLFFRSTREYRAILKAGADLAKSYNEQLNSDVFLKPLLERISQLKADDPKQADKLGEDIQELFLYAGGIAATKAGQS